MVASYWLVVAFLAGAVAEWKLGLWLLRHAMSRDLQPFEGTLGKLTYERLLLVAAAVEREIGKRRPA
jgi:hypothetical protein